MSSSPTRRASRRGSRASSCGYAALERVLHIHERLGNQQPVTAVTLARELETSDRTIKRDLAFMRDRLGAPLDWDAATHSYVYTRECDLLPLLRLDAAEALALLVARETFAAWAGSPLGRALTGALSKIAGVIGGAVSLPADTISNLVFQPDDTGEAAAEQRCFAVALEAIRRRRALRLEYRKPGAESAEERQVHPLHLAFLDHRWVLIAHDPVKNARRNFLLTRMTGIRATTATFTPPADFDLRTYLRGSLGRFIGTDEFDVRPAFAAELGPHLRERPWHPSQTLRSRTDGRLECTLRLNHLADVRRRILACGAQVEVLEPRELRDSLRAEAAALVTRYSPA